MCKTTLNLRAMRIMVMVLFPVVALLGLTKVVVEPMAWRMLMMAVCVTLLVDTTGLCVVLYRNRLFCAQVERILIAINFGMAIAPWVCMQSGRYAVFALWRLFVAIGGVAVFSLTTVVDDVYYVVRKGWRIARRIYRRKRRAAENNCAEAYPCTSPPGKVVKRGLELLKKIQKEVWKSMADFVEQAKAFSMNAVIPTKDQVCELNDLIDMMRAGVDGVIPGSEGDTVGAIAEEISGKLFAANYGQESAVPPELQAGVRQIVEESLASGGGEQTDGGWSATGGEMATVTDEAEDSFIDRRHPDLGAMRKRHSDVQTWLSVSLGTVLGIIGTRFEPMILEPLRQASSVWAALPVVMALVAAGLLLGIYVRFAMPRERLGNWIAIMVFVALVTGVVISAAQQTGVFGALTLVPYGIELGGMDVILIACAILAIYCMIFGIIYNQRCDEAKAAAFMDATEIMSKTDDVGSADGADFGQETLWGSMTLRQTATQFWLKELILPRMNRAA